MAGTNGSNGNGNGNGSARVGTSTVKQGLAQMLKGGVIVSRDLKRGKPNVSLELFKTDALFCRSCILGLCTVQRNPFSAYHL